MNKAGLKNAKLLLDKNLTRDGMEGGDPPGNANGRRRVLIIHQNFPGQFRHLALHLQARKDVEVIGLGRDTAPGLPNFPWYKYRLHRDVKAQTHPYVRQMESAVLHGQAVARAMEQLKRKGFVPDVIVAHPGWGETLYAKEIFPAAKLIHLCEWYYSTSGADFGFDPEFPPTLDDRLRINTWNALHLLNLEACDVAIAPTEWQKSRFPAQYHDKIQVIHEGIDTENLKPDPQASLTLPNGRVVRAGDPVVTYVARNLEPYRGFHIFMRALPEVLKANPDAQIVIVGGSGRSYGAPPKNAANWREKMTREIASQLGDNADRIHFFGRVPYETYKKVLQVSAVHVYLTYPFVLSWSLLEAMAIGCRIVVSSTAPAMEFIKEASDAKIIDFFDGIGIAKSILASLESRLTVSKVREVRVLSVTVAQQLERYISFIF